MTTLWSHNANQDSCIQLKSDMVDSLKKVNLQAGYFVNHKIESNMSLKQTCLFRQAQQREDWIKSLASDKMADVNNKVIYQPYTESHVASSGKH